MTPDVLAAATADNKARREARVAAQKKNHEDIVKARAEQAKSNEARMAADAKLRPTPTIEEVQMALAGHNVDIKEPNGAPEQNIYHPIMSAGAQIEVGRKMPEAASSASVPHDKADKSSTGPSAGHTLK